MGTLQTTLFVLLVAAPAALFYKEVPDRLSDIRSNKRWALAPPAVLAVMLPLATVAAGLDHLPVLGWGWNGANIAMEPVTSSASSASTAESGSSDESVALASLAGGALVVWFAMLVFNHHEERYFRNSWKAVAVWALLHTVMGIPLVYVVPIFGAGVVYKVVHDRVGLGAAYTAHLATNTTLLLLVVIAGVVAA